jgi:hypothetical protein
MIGQRVPAAMLRKIDKFADAFSVNRTNTLRFLLEAGIEAKAHYLRRGRGSRRANSRSNNRSPAVAAAAPLPPAATLQPRRQGG